MSERLLTLCLIGLCIQYIWSLHLYPRDTDGVLSLVRNQKHRDGTANDRKFKKILDNRHIQAKSEDTDSEQAIFVRLSANYKDQDEKIDENDNVKGQTKVLNRDSKYRVKEENQSFEPILVKRIIPHGYKTSKLELYPTLESFYKPLIRFHVKKPINQVNNSPNVRTKSKKGLLIILLNSPKDNTRYKAPKDSLVSLLEVGGKTLRKFDESVEGIDPLATPSSSSLHPTYSKNHYPFWYYWTLERPFHVDECDEGLVKVGNMCISHYN